MVRRRCLLSWQVPAEERTDIWLRAYEAEIVKRHGEWRFRVRPVGPLRA